MHFQAEVVVRGRRPMSLDAPHIPLEQHGETSHVFDTINRWFGRVFSLAIEFGKLMEREHEE